MTSTISDELRGLIEAYRSQHQGSVAAWSDTSGSITDNAARVETSDRLHAQAEGTMRRIREYCDEHSIGPEIIEELLR